MKLSPTAPAIAAGIVASTMSQAIFSSASSIARWPTERNHAPR